MYNLFKFKCLLQKTNSNCMDWCNYRWIKLFVKKHDFQFSWEITFIILLLLDEIFFSMITWRPPSLSELTPMIFNAGLTHLGSEASIYSAILLILYLFFQSGVSLLSDISYVFS